MLKLLCIAFLACAYAQTCDDRCEVCTEGVCDTCITNASHNSSGRCFCTSYWGGNDCSVYTGPCSPKCYGCQGPTDGDCNFCVPHASRNVDGFCMCDVGYSGDACTTQNSFDGTCDPKCYGGCMGATAFDCTRCVPNAAYNDHGECVCGTYYSGDDCSVLDNPLAGCDKRCYGCTGQTNLECIDCARHASHDVYGACVCDPYWTGEDCEISTIFGGICDSKCKGCSGPSAFECMECVANAHINDFGACVCDANYIGEDCTICTLDTSLSTSCNPKCYGGCSGSTDYDCYACVDHASKTKEGRCVCESPWDGDDCSITSYYHTECDSRCYGCTGPSNYECITCIENASHDKYKACVCDDGWTGTLCNINSLTQRGCDSVCNGCSGPTSYDCIECTTNAGRNIYGQCECVPFYRGSDCSIYTGDGNVECDPLCGTKGCSGPLASDCLDCIHNASFDVQGRCACDRGFSGANCTTYTLNMADVHYDSCAPKCRGCRGPGVTECFECVDNASKDSFGACVCQSGYSGDDCSIGHKDYGGLCSPKCIESAGCTGSTDKDCVRCVANAYVDSTGGCVCASSYTGDDCSIVAYSNPDYYDTTFLANNNTNGSHFSSDEDGYYYSEGGSAYAQYGKVYSYDTSGNLFHVDLAGNCDFRCYGGCTGPTNFDCHSCIVNSTLDSTGACVCNMGWSGSDCSIMDVQYDCDPKCVGCSGPNAGDCTTCITHASRNVYGYCQCDMFWSGDDCSIYQGTCSTRCETGCSGPEACDCITCVENAYTDVHGYCVCHEYYSGAACTTYVGPCNSKCYGCTGAEAFDCLLCVPNSQEDIYGACQCDENWGGDDCAEWQGLCHATCNGCNGPNANHCQECVVNSGFNSYGFCVCNKNWTGSNCEEFIGMCHERCLQAYGCTGPLMSNCKVCGMNSERDIYGNCQCSNGWTGDRCETYDGDCYSCCETCSGPNSNHCLTLKSNVTLDNQMRCVCEDLWLGDDCSNYIGPCDDQCIACFGPERLDCTDCADNATWEADIGCTCSENWTGFHCATFQGACDPKCAQGCTGPLNTDCMECMVHAAWDNTAKMCICHDDWWGSDCLQYIGECAITCADTCEADVDGDGDGDGATDTDGEAAEIDKKDCNYCAGPDTDQCQQCVPHSFLNYDGECQCEPDWNGDVGCTVYSGTCHHLCDVCAGPEPSDCVSCVDHANNDSGACECDVDWSDHNCDKYTGVCNDVCDGCFGDSALDCIVCIDHAHKDTTGACICDADYLDGLCVDFDQALCDVRCKTQDTGATCTGRSSRDCTQCTGNAYRNEKGECVCHADFNTNADCSAFSGYCDPICNGCTGPYPADCVACVANADGPPCVCQANWAGLDCSTWSGICDPKCNSCTHDGTAEYCFECVENAIWGETGCECETNWGGADCSEYSGDCADTCSDSGTPADDCNGPSAEHCTTCVLNAHRDLSGKCICNDGWGLNNCSTYNGMCSSMCDGACVGPGANNCVACITNAEADTNGYCVCSEEWGADNCSSYLGACNDLCDCCTGSTAIDCVQCIANAVRNDTGECVCATDWQGTLCETWEGACADACEPTGDGPCTGPENTQCRECRLNSHRDSNGGCVCDSDYNGSATCDVYSQTCDPLCTKCDGPLSSQCLECVDNGLLTDTTCACITDWYGEDCSVYGGVCAAHCERCDGPVETQCIKCMTHASRDATSGICACDTDWQGTDENDDTNVCLFSGECHPVCADTCTGPLNTDCDTCIANAYRNVHGICTCDENWVFDDCSQYRGECFHTCEGCTGPDDNQCQNCQEHATLDEDNFTCTCDDGWGGEGCALYLGACHQYCKGCFGPSEWECVYCIPNAYMSLQHGACLCADGWGGEKCLSKIYACHVSCDGCVDDSEGGAHECTGCLEGHTLSATGSGYCLPCAENCKGCAGMGSDQCTTCFDGFYPENGEGVEGQCLACHPACLTCTGALATECVTCAEGSSEGSPDAPGSCLCDNGPRHDTSFECLNSCATVATTDATGLCTAADEMALQFDFQLEAPLVSTVNTDQTATWCHPHMPIKDRGGFFDGKTQTLLVSGFEMYRNFSITMVVRALNTDATLFSAQMLLYTNADDDTGYNIDDEGNRKHIVDFFISSCNGLVFDFGPDRVESAEGLTTEDWTMVRITGVGTTIPQETSTVLTLYHNEDQVGQETSNYIIWPDKNPNFHIGSYKGVTYFLNGFINDFQYYLGDQGTTDLAAPAAISTCHWWQFLDLDDGTTCRNCDASCSHGCENNEACAVCHSSCRTCNGEGADECLTCWCNAHRVFPDQSTSCCECDDNTQGDADSCTPECADGCAACGSSDSKDCELCAADHVLLDTAPSSCITCVDQMSDNYYSACQIKGHRKPSGACTCGMNQWYDGEFCRHCSVDCIDCQDDEVEGMHCKECKPGFQFTVDADICLEFAPTGFYQLAGETQIEKADAATGLVGSFTFSADSSTTSIWEYIGTETFPSGEHSWTVKLFGGANELKVALDYDPYLSDDRGLWFDGKHNYMTSQMMTLHHTFTINTWIRPYGNGAIYSSSKNFDGAWNKSIHWGITENRMEFEDRDHYFYFKTERESVEPYIWQNLAITAEWLQSRMETTLGFYHNNDFVERKMYDHIIKDYPDYLYTHHVGTLERDMTLTHYYHGFIYTLKFWNKMVSSFMDEVSTECGDECSVCPAETTTCLGVCNWNSYANDGSCERCPIFCRQGCWAGGAC